MSEPWLSVVMPVYNGARYVREALQSIAAEGDCGIECVVVDGGSSDGSREVVEEFSGTLDIRLFVRPDFPNWVGKTNFAFTQARAMHVCMLHHDDIWLPGRAAAVRAELERRPDLSMVLHASRFIDESGGTLGRWSCPLRPAPAVYDAAGMLERLLIQSFIACPAPTFRRDIATAVGGLDADLWYAGDWDFYLKLAATGQTVYIDRELAGYRVHGNALTITASTDPRELRSQLDRVLARHLDRITDVARRESIRRAAEASNAVNAALAASLHGGYSALPGAMLALARIGPNGWRRYLTNSRIVERAGARWRARRELSRRAPRAAS